MEFKIAVVAYTDLSRFPSDRQVSIQAFLVKHLPMAIPATIYLITEVETVRQAKHAALVKYRQEAGA